MTRVVSSARMVLAVSLLCAFAFVLIGPILNLALWSVAERWYTPFKLPVTYGTRYWEQVFRPTGDAMVSLGTSVWIAVLTVVFALALSIPAGYALARLKLPMRALFMLMFLLPQAFPSVAIYINVARIFYQIGINGTISAVVLVHAAHGLVFSVWIAAAAFAAVDKDLELAARNMALRPAGLLHRDIAAGGAGHHRQRHLRVSRIARRVHRHLLRRRAAGHDAALAALQCGDGRQLPGRLDHGADPARAVGAVHAVHRALLRADVLAKVGA